LYYLCGNKNRKIMAILVNQLKLDVGIALRDVNHPMYQYALQYDTGVKELKDKFKNVIKFVRPGFPQRSKGTDSRGREVTMLEPKSPASLAGLQSGDIVTAIDVQAVNTADELRTRIADMGGSTTVTLTVRRGTESLDVPVTLGERPDPSSIRPVGGSERPMP
jgi:S1-C subfamily serine protease